MPNVVWTIRGWSRQMKSSQFSFVFHLSWSKRSEYYVIENMLVCISLVTRPIIRWLSAGVVIIYIVFTFFFKKKILFNVCICTYILSVMTDPPEVPQLKEYQFLHPWKALLPPIYTNIMVRILKRHCHSAAVVFVVASPFNVVSNQN